MTRPDAVLSSPHWADNDSIVEWLAKGHDVVASVGIGLNRISGLALSPDEC